MENSIQSVLGAIASGQDVEAATVIGALGMVDDAASMESALGQLTQMAEMISPDDLEGALGAVQSLRAALLNPITRQVTQATQAKAFAQSERMRAIVEAGTKLQSQDAQRPNVFLFTRFVHPAAGTLTVNDIKPSLPAQGTMPDANGPLHFIQARTFLRSGGWEDADIDIRVARVGAAQYQAPTGQPTPEGLPIEYFATQSYNTGLKPPRIRGLERADSNTVIGFTSIAVNPVTYGIVLEFVMESFLGGACGRVMPSLLRGPMAIIARGKRF